MNTDIRLKVGFFQNPKVRKLRMKYGADAVLALQELWMFTAQHRPDGILRDMDEDDVRLACGSHAPRILDALLDLKFVVVKDGLYTIHQWSEHQPWACSADKRSQNASLAARSKWEKIRNVNASRNAERTTECNAGRNAPTNQPTIKTKTMSPDGDYTEEFEAFWAKYPRKEKKGAAFKAFQKQKLGNGKFTEVMASLDTWLNSKSWGDGYVHHAATWITSKCYDDTPEQVRKANRGLVL